MSKQDTLETIQRIIEIPLIELQTEKFKMSGEDFTVSGNCCLCGKKIGKNPKLVHLLENGNIVSYNGSDIVGSQGFFPIGSECAKRLVIQFAF